MSVDEARLASSWQLEVGQLSEEFGEEAKVARTQDAKEAVQPRWYLTTLPQMLAHWNQDSWSVTVPNKESLSDGGVHPGLITGSGQVVKESHFAWFARAKEGSMRISLINAPPASLVDKTPQGQV